MDINKVGIIDEVLSEVFKSFQEDILVNGMPFKALVKDAGLSVFNENNEKIVTTRAKIMPGDTITYLNQNYLVISDVSAKSGNAYYKARMRRCPYRISITNRFWKPSLTYDPVKAMEPYYRPGGHQVMLMENGNIKFGDTQYNYGNATQYGYVGPYIRDAVMLDRVKRAYYSEEEKQERNSNWAIDADEYYEVSLLVKSFVVHEKILTTINWFMNRQYWTVIKAEETVVPGLMELTCRVDAVGVGYNPGENIGPTNNPFLPGININPIPQDIPYYPYKDPDVNIYAYDYTKGFLPTITMSNSAYIVPDIVHDNGKVVYKHKPGFVDGIVKFELPYTNFSDAIFDLYFRGANGQRIGVTNTIGSIPDYLKSLPAINNDPVVVSEFYKKYGNEVLKFRLLPNGTAGWSNNAAMEYLTTGNAQWIDLSKPYLYFGGVAGHDPDIIWFNFMKNPVPIPAGATKLCVSLFSWMGEGKQEIQFSI